MVDPGKDREAFRISMRNIPYGHQYIDEGDIRAVVKVLRSDWLTQGPVIKEFEDRLCSYTGAKYAVSVSSGTAALHLACLAARIGNGDEAITSPLTFVASANCALYCGGKAVFADIEKDSGNIDPEAIEKKLTKRTKVLIPVHYAGNPCDLKAVGAIAKKNRLLVIEDAAHALGALYGGSKIGSCKFSDMTILSFHPLKAITTGEGGAVLTNNKGLYQAVLMLRNHGITKDPQLLQDKSSRCGWYYEMQQLGFNYRMTDIQAALGISQLGKIDLFMKRRRDIADIYNRAFKDNDFFDTPVEGKGSRSAYHLYPIRLKERYLNRKKEIFASMRKMGLGVQVHYIPVYLQPYYAKLGFRRGCCPIAENYYDSEISLPIYPGLTKKDVLDVVKVVRKAASDHE